MADASGVDDRIKAFLEDLSPHARALLMNGLKTAAAKAPSDAKLTRVLGTIGAAETKERRTAPPPSDVAAQLKDAFFEPLRPFIVSVKLPTHQKARIGRRSCDQVWTWLARDLLPAEVKRALESRDAAAIAREAARLREQAVKTIRDVIRTVAVSPIATQRLVAQVGGERVYRDMGDMLAGFDRAEWVSAFLKDFPDKVTKKAVEENKALLAPLAQIALARPADVIWAMAALMPRLESPGVLLRMAIALAGSPETSRLVKTPFAAAVDLFLSEIEIEVQRLRDSQGRDVPLEVAAASVARFHGLCRELEGRVEIAASSNWGKRLGASKTAVSTLIEAEITGAPGLIRRILRARDMAGQPLGYDPDIHAEAERALRIIATAGEARESLAVNGTLGLIRRDIEQAFETLAAPLIEALRNAYGEERDALIRRTDSVVKLAEIHFGPDYSAAIRRSRHAAIHGPMQKLAGR